MSYIKKYKEGGIENALYDAPGRGRNPEITDEEKNWILTVEGMDPYPLGYWSNQWTYYSLAEYIRKNAEQAGFTRLSSISPSTVRAILMKTNVKPYHDELDPHWSRMWSGSGKYIYKVFLTVKTLYIKVDDDGKCQPWDTGEYIRIFAPEEECYMRQLRVTPTITDKDRYHVEKKKLFVAIDILTGEIIYHAYKAINYDKLWNNIQNTFPSNKGICILFDESTSGTLFYIGDYNPYKHDKERSLYVCDTSDSIGVKMADVFLGKALWVALQDIKLESKREFGRSVTQCVERINVRTSLQK